MKTFKRMIAGFSAFFFLTSLVFPASLFAGPSPYNSRNQRNQRTRPVSAKSAAATPAPANAASTSSSINSTTSSPLASATSEPPAPALSVTPTPVAPTPPPATSENPVLQVSDLSSLPNVTPAPTDPIPAIPQGRRWKGERSVSGGYIPWIGGVVLQSSTDIWGDPSFDPETEELVGMIEYEGTLRNGYPVHYFEQITLPYESPAPGLYTFRGMTKSIYPHTMIIEVTFWVRLKNPAVPPLPPIPLVAAQANETPPVSLIPADTTSVTASSVIDATPRANAALQAVSPNSIPASDASNRPVAARRVEVPGTWSQAMRPWLDVSVVLQAFRPSNQKLEAVIQFEDGTYKTIRLKPKKVGGVFRVSKRIYFRKRVVDVKFFVEDL